MEKNKKMQKNKNLKAIQKAQNGITLVALVITIIILIILATVAINFAFGNNGLINRAEQASDFYANDTKYTEESMTNVESYLDEMIAGTGGSGDDETEIALPTTVLDAKENETKYTDTTPITDDLGNTVYIPGGFHVDKEDSGTKVEDGIVIEDDNENQFVWIPTGTYQTTDTDESIKTNELSRRQWATTADVVQVPNLITDDDGVNGNNGTYYGERDNRSVANDTIDMFLASASVKCTENENGHGGFYIGRYEQGIGNVCKAGVDPYVNVTRNEAKTQAETMYSSNYEIKATTQLISSLYAKIVIMVIR